MQLKYDFISNWEDDAGELLMRTKAAFEEIHCEYFWETVQSGGKNGEESNIHVRDCERGY